MPRTSTSTHPQLSLRAGFLGSIGLGIPILASHFFFVLQLLQIQRGAGAIYTHTYYRHAPTGRVAPHPAADGTRCCVCCKEGDTAVTGLGPNEMQNRKLAELVVVAYLTRTASSSGNSHQGLARSEMKLGPCAGRGCTFTVRW